LGPKNISGALKKIFSNLRRCYTKFRWTVKKRGEFYNKVTRDFIAKFGMEDDVSKDPAEDPPNPWDNQSEVDDDLDEPLTKEEADKRSEYFQKLHTVSSINIY
jgi:hypothetical protein